MISCDVNSLADASKCFQCLEQGAVRTYLLCQIANGEAPPVPDAPTNLDINTDGIDVDPATWQIVLTWQETGSPDTAQIWRSENGGAYHQIGSVAGGTLTYTDDASAIPNLDVWDYKVRVVKSGIPSSFSSVVTVLGGVLHSPSAGTFSYPTAKVCLGDFDFFGSMVSTVTSVSAPQMKVVTGLFELGSNSFLTTVTTPALERVLGDFDIGDTAIVSISFPNLVFVQGLWGLGFGLQLISCTTNAGILFTDGVLMLCQNCALPSAQVNFYLARAVATGCTTATIDFTGGTNGAPTGQGIIDKAILITNGCTVDTN